MTDARADLGPAFPPRGVIYAKAAELHALARLAMEFSLAGSRCDLPRAIDKLEKMRAVLGDTDDSS